MIRTPALLLAPLLLALGSCAVTRNVQDPTVTIMTAGGTELGVSTSHGVVFLGSTARSGEVDMTVWYGDGPSIEASLIEPIGDGLFLAQGEIRLPMVEVAFHQPSPDDHIYARGRQGRDVWEIELFPTEDPRVEGLAFRPASPLPRDASQIGAGVFWTDPETDRPALIGLVSGRVRLGDGTEYVTAIGSEGLWRLVAVRRDSADERRWVYREDIL
jgi:hypothetical protein